MAIKIILDYILITLPEIYLMSWMGLVYSGIKIINPIKTFLLPLTIIRLIDLINTLYVSSTVYQTVITIAILFLGFVITHLMNSDEDRFKIYKKISSSFIKTAITVSIIQVISSLLMYVIFKVDTIMTTDALFYISRMPMLVGYYYVIMFLKCKRE